MRNKRWAAPSVSPPPWGGRTPHGGGLGGALYFHAAPSPPDQNRVLTGEYRRIYTGANSSAAYAFLGGAAVVSAGEGAPAPLSREAGHVERQPAAGQNALVGPLARQQCLGHRRSKVEQLARACSPTLAQRRARRQQAHAQRLLVERVAPKVFDGVKVALALHAQADVRRTMSLWATALLTGNAAASRPSTACKTAR